MSMAAFYVACLFFLLFPMGFWLSCYSTGATGPFQVLLVMQAQLLLLA
jgi:hypothetical protein